MTLHTATSGQWRVGVDSGGTFTDICVFDEHARELHIWKVPSTPHDPSEAIAAGIAQALSEATGGAEVFDKVSYVGHGTTVATNALIQNTGVPTGLITTKGFRDLLEIARQRRPSLYDWTAEKPTPLVQRDSRLEVTERVLYDGRVEVPLDLDEVRENVRQLKAKGVRSVAVCLLYSYIRPDHENAIRDIVREEYPEAFVSVSSEVAPEFREYERLSTVVINATLGPIIARYLDHLSNRLRDLGITAPPHLTQSNGGVISFENASAFPVKTILSGPATGIVAACELGKASGVPDMITFDMGGTSSDVALIEGSEAKLSSETVVHGYPLKTPTLEINTVGAGGGSIAYVDAGGFLKVGPRSAGAYPGPVCYGLGNSEPTVTDANVVLQVLNPEYLLGGRMKISRQASYDTIEKLGAQIGLDALQTAQGIISIVTSNMAKAIRVISVQRGYDPRDFTLLAFGGAGPVHASRLARELEIPRIMVPKNPGVLCALGLLLTDLKSNRSLSRLIALDDAQAEQIRQAFSDLTGQAASWFVEENIPQETRRLRLSADMRYKGQNYELSVEIDPAAEDIVHRLKDGFETAHRKRYGSIADASRIEITTFRVEMSGVTDKVRLQRHDAGPCDPETAIIAHRDVYLPECGGMVSIPVFNREALTPGTVVEGPAVVEQADSTTLILPGQTATVDELLSLMIEEKP